MKRLKLYKSGPAGLKNLKMGSRDTCLKNLIPTASRAASGILSNRYFPDGGLGVLFGNIASNGCIVKTAGVDPSIFKFKGPARVFESQEDACDGY